MIRDVAPATKLMAVIACDHHGPMTPTMSLGITMCSGMASEWNPSSSAVRATSWKSPGAIERSQSLLIGGYRLMPGIPVENFTAARSHGVHVGVDVVLGDDLGIDEALVLVVVELQELAEHVVVVLAEHRRTAVPRLRDTLERVPDVRIRAD